MVEKYFLFQRFLFVNRVFLWGFNSELLINENISFRYYIFVFNNIICRQSSCTDCKRKCLFGIFKASKCELSSNLFKNISNLNKLKMKSKISESRKSLISNELLFSPCKSSFRHDKLDFKFALRHFAFA